MIILIFQKSKIKVN